MNTVILYFGADASFEDLNELGYRRRNTNFMRALSELHEVTVFNVQYAQRRLCVQHHLDSKKRSTPQKNQVDITITHWIPKGVPGSPIINAIINRFLIRRKMREKFTKAEPSIISWTYWPQGFDYWKLGWNKGQMVFDADHNIVEDPNLSATQYADRKARLKEAGDRSTLVISSSRSMNEWFKESTATPTALIMNAVDAMRFALKGDKVSESDGKLTIGYLGTFSKWIDFSALENFIETHPQCQFKFGGKAYKLNHEDQNRLNGLREASNTTWLGDVPFADVPAFLKTIDIGLSLYQPHPALDVNSMKIYEYLAAGIPVLAKPNHAELAADFDDLLVLTAKEDEHANALKKCQQLKTDSNWNAKRKQFIQQSSWTHRAQSVLDSLNPDS